MKKTTGLAALLAVALLAAPAAAELYTVTLANGNTLESRYQPQVAGWDEGTILVLTDVGNWIGLDRTMITDVVTDMEARGFGRQISAMTLELGPAPNDAPVPSDEPLDAQAQMLELLRAQNRPVPNYSVPQFVDPDEAAGIPGSLIDQ